MPGFLSCHTNKWAANAKKQAHLGDANGLVPWPGSLLAFLAAVGLVAAPGAHGKTTDGELPPSAVPAKDGRRLTQVS